MSFSLKFIFTLTEKYGIIVKAAVYAVYTVYAYIFCWHIYYVKLSLVSSRF